MTKESGEGADQSLLDLADSTALRYTFDYATGKLVPPPELAEAAPSEPLPKTSIQKFAARRKPKR
jgi:hypothetical protein